MKILSDKYAYIIALAAGFILWEGTTILTARSEAWDSSLYWIVAYPLALFIAAILGYLAPSRPWRWALTIMLIQPVLLAIFASSFGLLPLGIFLFGLLSLPSILIAFLTAWIRNRGKSIEEKGVG